MKKYTLFSAFIALIISSYAQKWTEIKKLLPEPYIDIASDFYGCAVAIEGNYAVIGSKGYKNNQGCAFVYFNNGTNWNQVGKLAASDSAAGDLFGCSVDISGDVIVIGAALNNGNTGAVYVFEKPVGGWINATETAKLTGSDIIAGDWFGYPCSISDDIIVVGTYRQDNFKGAAYIFEKPVGGWIDATENAKLIASDQANYDYFGYSVSVSGNYIIVGATENDDNGNASGAAYVFQKPIGGWINTTETAKLLPSDGSTLAYFGRAVDIDDDIIIIGAYDRVYMYIKPLTGWVNTTETMQLHHKFINPIPTYGEALNINDFRITVGASGISSGWAYIYEKPANGWKDTTETVLLLSSEYNLQLQKFGKSVSINENFTIIGAEGNNELGDNVGAAYIFESLPNNAPTDIILSNNSINENVAINTIIGGFSAVDIDSNDNLIFTLVEGNGTNDADNDKFFIGVDDSLYVNTKINYERQTSYNIYVQADDGWGGILQEAFTITVNDLLDSVNIDTTICPNSHIMFGGAIIMDVGTYKEYDYSVYGYDSITLLNLYHYPSYTVYDTMVICSGDSAFILGEYREPNMDQNYSQHLFSVNGCDSFVNIHLNVNPAYLWETTYPICEGDSVLINGVYYKEAGTFCDSLKTINSCDSIFINHIIVNQPVITHIFDTICPGEVLKVGVHYYEVAGEYFDTLSTSKGCDSVLVTHLSIYPEIDIELSDTVYACDGNEMLFGFSRFDIETYYWSNYLGATSNTPEFNFIFNHLNPPSSVYLLVTDTFGCKFEKNIRIIDNEIGGGGIITLNYANDPEIYVSVVDNFTNHDYTYWSLDGSIIQQPATSNNITYTYTENGTYKVCYIARNFCGEDSVCALPFDINNANIENIKNELSGNIVIFPNPTTGEFELTGINPGTLVEITDVAGKSMFRETINSSSFKYSLMGREAGLYIIYLTHNGATSEIKVMLVK